MTKITTKEMAQKAFEDLDQATMFLSYMKEDQEPAKTPWEYLLSLDKAVTGPVAIERLKADTGCWWVFKFLRHKVYTGPDIPPYVRGRMGLLSDLWLAWIEYNEERKDLAGYLKKENTKLHEELQKLRKELNDSK